MVCRDGRIDCGFRMCIGRNPRVSMRVVAARLLRICSRICPLRRGTDARISGRRAAHSRYGGRCYARLGHRTPAGAGDFSGGAVGSPLPTRGERFEIIWNIIRKKDSSARADRHILNIPDTALEALQSPLATSHEARFRSEMGQISRQSAVFFAGTLFTAGAGYLFKIYLARVLGAEALGIYALGMTVGGVLGLIAALGLPYAAARYVAIYSGTGRYSERKGFLWNCLAVFAVANLIVATVLFLVSGWVADRFYHTAVLSKYMGAFAGLMVLGSFTLFFGQALAGFKDVARRTVITNFIGSPLNILFSVALLMLGMELSGYLLAQIASGLITLVLLALATWKLMPRGHRSMAGKLPGLQREAIRFSASLFAVQALEYTFSQLDKIVVGYYLDARTVGIYVVAMSVTTFLAILLQS